MREFSVGNLITSYRTRLGWHQNQVVDPDKPNTLSVALRTYQGWENGERVPSNKWLHRIATFFDLTDEEADTLYRAAAQVAPEIQNLPLRNNFFTGRETLLKNLDDLFKKNDSVAITQRISISGLGGIGKTQLALEYAHRCYPKVYRTVLWVDAADKATLEASYLSVAKLLKLPEQNESKIEHVVQAVKTWLEVHSSWLLILDNADDLQLARSFLPITRGHTLLTTRSQIVGDITPIEVEAMEPSEGLLFLLRRSRKLNPGIGPETIASDIRDAAAQLVELLGGHPLALDQAGAYIDEAQTSFATYIELYHKQRLLLLAERSLLGKSDLEIEHPETVVVTFEVSFQRACKLYPIVADILHFCSFLHPDNIPEELFSHNDILKLDTGTLDKAVASLRHYSLIKRNAEKKLLSVHRLVQAVIKDSMDDSEQKLWAQSVVQVVGKTFPYIKFETWWKCDLWLPHAQLCIDYINKYCIQTLEAAQLLNQTGLYLQKRGRYAEAELPLQRALEMKERIFGGDDLKVAESLHRLAELYRTTRKGTQTESLYKRAIDIRKQRLGEEHQDVATVLNDLALFYRSQGRFLDAEPLHMQALEIMEKVLGPDHLKVATILNNLAVLRRTNGKFVEAEQLFQKVLEIWRQQLGEDHPHVAQVLNNLAGLYREQEKYVEAEPLYLQALRTREQAQRRGEESEKEDREHPDVAQSLNGLGDLYRAQGRYEEAGLSLHRALRIREQILGKEHWDTLQSLVSLAELYRVQGIVEKAEALYEQVLHTWEQNKTGTMHAGASLNGLAYMYEMRGEYIEAERLLLHALRLGAREQLGPNAPRIKVIRDHYISLLRSQGREEEAWEVLREQKALSSPTLPDNIMNG